MSISIYKWTGEAYGITDYIDRTTSLRITYKQPQGAIGYTEAVLDIKCESESEAHGLFPKETKIKISDTARASKGFYDGPNLFVGYVDRHKWDEDNLTLRITLRDYLEFKLEKKLNAALFVDQRPSDIISWLGNKIGVTTFKLLPDATDSKYDPVIPFYYVEEDTTVRELLTTIVEALGGKCFLSPGKEPFTLVMEYGCLYNSYNGTSLLSISTTNTKNDAIDYKAKSYAYYEVKINKKKAIYDSFTIANIDNPYEVPAEGVGCDPNKPHYITFDNPVLKISDLTFLGDSSLSLDSEVWNSNFIDDDPTNYLKNPFKIQVKINNSASNDQQISDFYFTIYTIIKDTETQGKGDLTGTNENTWTLESDMISVNDDWNKRRVTWEASKPVDVFNANIQDFSKIPYIGPKDSVSNQPYYIIDLDGAKIAVEELEYNYSNEVWTLKGNGDRSTYDPTDTDDEETNEPKLPENLKNYTAILTNEAHTVLCDFSGNPKTGETGSTGKAITQVLAFRNAHLLSAVDSSPGGGKFSITVTGEDCTAGKSENDGVYLVSFDSGKDSAKIKIEINLEGKLTVEKYMTISKAIEGAPGNPGEPGEPGTPGEDAKAGRVAASSQIIVYDNSGNNPVPNTSTDITITATAINFTPTAYKFYKSVNGGEETLEQNGTGNTYTLPVNSGYSGYVYTVRVEFHDASGKQAEDQITVAEVKDGNVGDGNTPAAPTNLVTDSDAVGGIFLTASWTKSTSKDINYYLVEWKKITETWDDANVLAVLECNARLPADRGESYNIRVRAHDYDDLYSAYLNASRIQETVNGDGIDPEAPTGLSLTSEYVEQQVWLKISWTRSASKDTSYYEIWLKEDSGSYSKIGETIGTFYRAPVLANTKYYVKLKAVDIEDLSSDYSNEANHTTTNYPNPDNTANINTSAGKTLIFVAWDNIISGKNIEADPKFNYYELQRKTGIAGLYVVLSKQRNNTYTDKSVSYDSSYYYRVRTVSKSGAVGSWIETSSGTSPNRNGVDDLEAALRLRAGQQILVGSDGNEAVKIGYDALPDNEDGIYIPNGGAFRINIKELYDTDKSTLGYLASATDIEFSKSSGDDYNSNFSVGDLVFIKKTGDTTIHTRVVTAATSSSLTINKPMGDDGINSYYAYPVNRKRGLYYSSSEGLKIIADIYVAAGNNYLNFVDSQVKLEDRANDYSSNKIYSILNFFKSLTGFSDEQLKLRFMESFNSNYEIAQKAHEIGPEAKLDHSHDPDKKTTGTVSSSTDTSVTKTDGDDFSDNFSTGDTVYCVLEGSDTVLERTVSSVSSSTMYIDSGLGEAGTYNFYPGYPDGYVKEVGTFLSALIKSIDGGNFGLTLNGYERQGTEWFMRAVYKHGLYNNTITNGFYGKLENYDSENGIADLVIHGAKKFTFDDFVKIVKAQTFKYEGTSKPSTEPEGNFCYSYRDVPNTFYVIALKTDSGWFYVRTTAGGLGNFSSLPG